MKKYLIVAIAFIFFAGAGTTFAAAPKITHVLKDGGKTVDITIDCSECAVATPGYVELDPGNLRGNFTNLKKGTPLTVTINGLTLGTTYQAKAWSTGTKTAGNQYLYSEKAFTPDHQIIVPANQTSNGNNSGNNTLPYEINVVKSGTSATISITCNLSCNQLESKFTLKGDNYSQEVGPKKLLEKKATQYNFTGLTEGKTYTLSGKPYYTSSNGDTINFPDYTFTMDGKNQGPQTVNVDDPTNINAQKYGGDVTSTTYTLLAPIDGTKTIETNSIGDYFNKIFNIIIGLCAALAVIMLVVNGIKYMTSESFTEKSELKKDMGGPILGLIIALGAYALLNTIDPALTGKQGLSVDTVSADIDENEIPILSDDGTKLPPAGKVAKCPEGVQQVSTATVKFIACKSISSNLVKMIADAKAQGVTLTGGGFRTYEGQVEARKRNHCPDIYKSPANACRPQTAPPGMSMHESGLAFDLKCDIGGSSHIINWDRQNPGFGIEPKTKRCFDWLTTNASKYGLANLKKENWHWSTNGH